MQSKEAPSKRHHPDLEKYSSYRLMFYNVENLFDTINDPLKKDNDFTPEGSYVWNSFRYQQKLDNIARVSLALGEGSMPDIIAFCEVENRRVLEDLNERSLFNNHDYRIVHQESDDERGIDVALLFNSKSVTPISFRAVPVVFSEKDARPTRDILYFKGFLKDADTLHFLVNHWPSRYGGAEASEPKRKEAASTARTVVDSILKLNPKASIILTGDFNDDPDNESLFQILGAKEPGSGADLINYTFPYKQNDKRGTLKYQGNWNYFDQFIVSAALMDNHGLETSPHHYQIFYGTSDNEFLLEIDDRFQGLQPFRTYRGRTFHGGFSDHLPVYLDVYFKK